MTRESLLEMDPNILVSIVNMKLRDEYSSLDSFCDDIDISKEEIIKKLSSVDKKYDKQTNQFK